MIEFLGVVSIFLILALLAVPVLAVFAAMKIGFALLALPLKLFFLLLKLALGLVVFSIAFAVLIGVLSTVAVFVIPVLLFGVFIFGSIKLLAPATA